MSKIIVAMSGGVDSSTAAWILQNQGHKVSGLTFVTGFEHSNQNIERAKLVCDWLGVPHQVLDIRKEFQEKVVQSFIYEYTQARTPNPCVICNRHIKFALLISTFGTTSIATGHYIRFRQLDNIRLIQRGKDPLKDQSYFLCMVQKEALSHILFPLGELTKEAVKQQAESIGLPLSPKLNESQDVCFVDKDYRNFLKKNGIQNDPGDFVYQGKIVGQHKGIPFYALGQRRRLGISVGHKVFIREMDTASKTIRLGQKPISQEFDIEQLNLFVPELFDKKYNIQVRYQSKVIAGSLQHRKNSTHIVLDEPHEIIADGQFAAIYDNDLLVGGGLIANPVLL